MLLVSLSFFLLDGFHDFFDDNSGMFGRLGDAVLAIAIFWFLVSFLGVYVVIQALLKFPRFQKPLLYLELFVLTIGVSVLGFFQVQSLSIKEIEYDGSETCSRVLTDELYADCIASASKEIIKGFSGKDLVEQYDFLCRPIQKEIQKSICFYSAHTHLPIGNNLCSRFSDDISKVICIENEMRNYLEKRYGYPNDTNYETDVVGLKFCEEKHALFKNVEDYFSDSDFEYREKLQLMSSCFETTAGFNHCEKISVQPFRDRCYLRLLSIDPEYCSKVESASAREICIRCREQGNCIF